jgi:3-oxoacyl-[acyl-carrier-protein] synthase-3
MISAGIKSLAIEFPSGLRTNEYYIKKHSEEVKNAAEGTLHALWNVSNQYPPDVFEEEMNPYLSDPFRGTQERRVCAPGETTLSVELKAANAAIIAAALEPKDIDLLISVAFQPDYLMFGNAPFLADALGLSCASWNMETACAGGVAALRTAAALVRAREHKNVLVVVSCMYSKVSDDSDTFTWFLGDGAGAFIVSEDSEGFGVIGASGVSTTETNRSFRFTAERWPDQWPIILRYKPFAARALKTTAEKYLLECCSGALNAAGVKMDDIKWFVCNTPTAWYAKFIARTLGISQEAIIDTYPRYANNGTALMPVNLYSAAKEKGFQSGDLILVYSVGSVSSAGSIVMKWGDVVLGPPPSEPTWINFPPTV